MNIEDLIQHKKQYIKKLESDKKASLTIKSYSYNLDKMMEYIENNCGDEFNIKTTILAYIDNLDKSYKATTINTIRSAIRGFISFLHSREYIKEDFGGSITFLKEYTTPKEILEPGEIDKVYNVLVSELKGAKGYNVFYKARNFILFAFLLYTGVRRSEVVKVKWSDIDFINNEITIIGKGNKTRIIPLKTELKQQLYTYRDILEQMNMVGYNVKSEYIFRSEKRNKITKLKDKPMTGKNVEIIIKDICNKAGVEKNITPHSIRHTFASYGIKNGMNPPSLTDILGHSAQSTTLNIYTHEISMREKKKEMEKIKFDI